MSRTSVDGTKLLPNINGLAHSNESVTVIQVKNVALFPQSAHAHFAQGADKSRWHVITPKW